MPRRHHDTWRTVLTAVMALLTIALTWSLFETRSREAQHLKGVEALGYKHLELSRQLRESERRTHACELRLETTESRLKHVCGALRVPDMALSMCKAFEDVEREMAGKGTGE